jgi:hypothetical protein
LEIHSRVEKTYNITEFYTFQREIYKTCTLYSKRAEQRTLIVFNFVLHKTVVAFV